MFVCFLPTTCKCIRTKPRVTQPHTSNTFVEGSELKKTPTVWRWDLKCCRNHHSGGLNINEKLFVSAENVSVGIFSTVVGISDNLVSTHHCSSITTGPDQTDQWEKGTHCCCGIHALIGWYTSVLLNTGPVFQHAQSMACSPLTPLLTQL